MHLVILRAICRRVTYAAISLLLPGGRHVWYALLSIKGHLYPQEAVLLYQIGRFASAGRPVVEIGSLCGLSTCCLASGIRRSIPPTKIVAIDPHVWGSELAFRDNLRRLGADPVVDVRVARAEEVAQNWMGELSAVFIDGDHALRSVMQDFTTWSPKVGPGGFVLIHDTRPPSKFAGPAFVAETRLQIGEHFDAVGYVGSISWGRKIGGEGWLPTLPSTSFLDRFIGFAHGRQSELQS